MQLPLEPELVGQCEFMLRWPGLVRDERDRGSNPNPLLWDIRDHCMDIQR
jgi:hypothetical protein